MGFLNFPQFRYHGPWVQMLIAGIGVGSSAGIYVALNLLGAGGGRPDSAQVVQVVNATLCAGIIVFCWSYPEHLLTTCSMVPLILLWWLHLE